MVNSDLIMGMVRGWKGAASSVLWVLLLAEMTDSTQGKTAVQLEQATGYSDKPVRQALRDLERLGLVKHFGKRRGWRLRKGPIPQKERGGCY
jgi:hypothetical protein